MFTRILVPLDGSPLAEKASPKPRNWRGCSKRRTLIQVVDLNRLDHFGLEEFVGAASLADQFAEAAGPAEYLPDGPRTQDTRSHGGTDVRCGDPAREFGRGGEAGDLLVISTRGRGGAMRLLLGSVAESVLRHAPSRSARSAQEDDRQADDERTLPPAAPRHAIGRRNSPQLLNMDAAVVRQAALAGRLHAQIADHHVLSITRADALSWLAERG